jgi:hypothetical protein
MQKIKELLVQLDLETLKKIPCYCDNINLITFRIGDKYSGPMIEFSPIDPNNFDFVVRSLNGKEYNIPVSKDSDEFQKCQNINLIIRELLLNNEYLNSLIVPFNIEVFNGNLVRLTNPIFI